MAEGNLDFTFEYSEFRNHLEESKKQILKLSDNLEKDLPKELNRLVSEDKALLLLPYKTTEDIGKSNNQDIDKLFNSDHLFVKIVGTYGVNFEDGNPHSKMSNKF